MPKFMVPPTETTIEKEGGKKRKIQCLKIWKKKIKAKKRKNKTKHEHKLKHKREMAINPPVSWPLMNTRNTSRMLSIVTVGVTLFAFQNEMSSSETYILQSKFNNR